MGFYHVRGQLSFFYFSHELALVAWLNNVYQIDDVNLLFISCDDTHANLQSFQFNYTRRGSFQF
jgi:hypothetical protein